MIIRTDNNLFHMLDNVKAYKYMYILDTRNIFVAVVRLWVLSILYNVYAIGPLFTLPGVLAVDIRK